MLIKELLEAFNQPYDYSWRTVVDSPERGFKEIHARFLTARGDPGRVEFLQTNRPDGSRSVDINFSIKDSVQRVPAQGTEQRIFSTVLNTIRQYVQQHKPDVISFSGQGADRNRLYQKLVQRELRTLPGYTIDQRSMPNQIDAFMLVRNTMNRPQVLPGKPLNMPGTQDHDPRLGADLDPKAMMKRWK